MNAEKISDALLFLDDDIIEEANALRLKKKNYKSIWIKCLSAAACLCIALVAVLGVAPQFELFSRGSGTNNLSQNNSAWAGTKEESQPVDEFKYGGAFGSVAGSISLPDNGAYLEVTEWKSNCFYALVLSSKNEELTNGMKVKVKFEKSSGYSKLPSDGLKVQLDGDGEYYSWQIWDKSLENQGRPQEKDFPVGTKVYVSISKVRNSFLNSKAEKVIKSNQLYEYKGEVPTRDPNGFFRTTYYVEITKWGKNEFSGIIKGSEGGSGKLPMNEEFMVKFDENIRVRKQGEKFENCIPTEEDFPVGSRVEVLVNDYDAPKYLETSELRTYSISDLSMPQTVLVRIDEWSDKGFTGTLSGENGQQAFYYTNNTAIVEFTENTRTESREKLGTTTISLAPTEEDFPVGTVVEVSYRKSTQKSITETVYTAERVWLYEQKEDTYEN